MFDDEFFENLPKDAAEAGLTICNKFIDFDSLPNHLLQMETHQKYIEAYAALTAFLEANNIPFGEIDYSDNPQNNIMEIQGYFRIWQHEFENMSLVNFKNALKRNLVEARDRFKIKFGTVFCYQLSDGDLNRIQTLVNELRVHIVDSELFDANHKERILRKLEGIQLELHKKMSSLAKFWDLMGEAGVALGKFGKDAKPFVDRIREILQITWRTQVRAEELPSATPLPLLSHGQAEVKEQE